MKKKLLLLFFLTSTIHSFSQAERTLIFGAVKTDSRNIEGIHILNKNSGKGSITSGGGQFRIRVRENDTLLISGIQFYYKELIISKDIVKNKTVTLNLFLKINELEEVEVRSHNLSGNLATDATKIKDTVSKVDKNALDFSMIDFGKPVVNDIDDIDRKKPPNASNLTNPNIPVSGNILGLLGFALDPLIGQIDKVRKKRKFWKNEERIYKEKVSTINNDIVIELGELFFTNTLNIPKEQIEEFIEHCKSKGIVDLYLKGRKIEFLDILIKESRAFKNLKE